MLRLASNELVSAYITSQGILYIETFLKKKKKNWEPRPGRVIRKTAYNEYRFRET